VKPAIHFLVEFIHTGRQFLGQVYPGSFKNFRNKFEAGIGIVTNAQKPMRMQLTGKFFS
jgi:hypothetical protein